MQKVIVELTDDLDGKPADETVRFGLDGRELEIDLRATNARALRKAVQPFVDAGRKVGPGHRGAGRPPARRRLTANIRAWARERGYEPNERGRIPEWIMDEYKRVHGT